MLLSQLVVAAALVGMALVQPQQGQLLLGGFALDQLLVFGALALVVAFASATQDIVIDAWRIESADNNEQQGLLTSTSTLGYRARAAGHRCADPDLRRQASAGRCRTS